MPVAGRVSWTQVETNIVYGATTLAATFGATTAGEAAIRGRVSYTDFTVGAAGGASGATTLAVVFTATVASGPVTVFGAVSQVTTAQFTTESRGQPKVAAAGLVFLHGDRDDAPVTRFGAASAAFGFTATTAGVANHFAAVSLPIVFGASAGTAVVFGQTSLAVSATFTTRAQRQVPYSLYETLLRADRPIAWWGLDGGAETEDESGHGYTLTVVGAPELVASIIPRGDDARSGARRFDGSDDAYRVDGTIRASALGPPAFHASARAISTGTEVALVTPGELEVDDLMLAVCVHSVQTATVSTPPSGWTQIGSTLNAGTHAVAVYKRVAASADLTPQEVKWIWSTSGTLACGLLAYRGLDVGVAGLVFDSGVQATVSGAFHSTTTETHPEQARQVAIWTSDSTATVSADPTGKTDRLSVASGNLKILAVDYARVQAGSGARTATTSADTQLGAILVTFGAAKRVVYAGLDDISKTASIHAVARPTVVVGARTLIRKHGSWGLRLNGSTLQFLFTDGGGVDRTVNGPTLSAGVTAQLIVVDDGTNVKFWKDGVLTSVARPGAAGYTVNANPIVLGAHWTGASYDELYDGRLDEPAVWNSPLSAQMAQAYRLAFSEGLFGSQGWADPGGSRYPRIKLEVAFASDPTDECLVYEDVTSYLRAASVETAHRNFELDRIEAGRMDVILSNRAREFDDTNAASPFYPNVKPTRAIRLRAQASVDGPVYGVFYGFTEGHPVQRPGGGQDSVAAITSIDPFKVLALDKIADTLVRPQELTGFRLAAVLDVAGFPFAGEGGQSEVAGDDLIGVNRLDHAQAVAETDGGILFCDSDGVVVFQDRHHRTKLEREVRAVYGNGGGAELPFRSLEPRTDEARLFTAASVTPASGNVQSVRDEAAIGGHFVRTKDISTLHASDNDARGMAEAFAHRYATPRTRVPEIRLAPVKGGEEMWEVVLSHELSHRVQSVDRPLGGGVVTRDHFIEGIRHELSPSTWLVIFSVSPAELEGEYWLLGTGQLGDASGLTSTVLGW